MIIEKTRFGTIEVEDDKIIAMKRSMPGFTGRKRFVILNREEIQPFQWYQCIEDPALAFVIVNPFLLKEDYTIDLIPIIDEMEWQIDGEKGDQLAVFVLVNASSGIPEKMTANLMAPLIINTERFEAVQVIIQDSGYSHRHPLFNKAEDSQQSISAAAG